MCDPANGRMRPFDRAVHAPLGAAAHARLPTSPLAARSSKSAFNKHAASPSTQLPFARMSANCSSIQSPGSREVTISASPRARRRRSSVSIVSAA